MIETLSHPAQSAEFLSRLHDGELTPAEAAAFESHRRECAECRASVAEFEGALAAYRSAPVPPHASDLSARILRKIRAGSPSRRPFGVTFGIDVRWAGALVAALLVVIIGAPVFSRREIRQIPAPASPAPSSAPIPAYVLDAEEERPSEKRAEPKARSRAAVPPRKDAEHSAKPKSEDSRSNEVAATNADKLDQAAPAEGSVAPESQAPSLMAAAPPAESKEIAKSAAVRRQSAAAPVGGEAGSSKGVDEAAEDRVRISIQAVDGEGGAPDLVRSPSDERLAPLRGRGYVLVVDSGGRVVAVEERPADRNAARDEASEADDAAGMKSLADSILRELAFQPSDRTRRLVVDIR